MCGRGNGENDRHTEKTKASWVGNDDDFLQRWWGFCLVIQSVYVISYMVCM